MNLENARHFLRLSMAAYGWPFVMYRYCGTGIFRLLKEVTCCSCFRTKSTMVTDDNCCLCHLAGVKHISKIREEDILFASFRNHVFEVGTFPLTLLKLKWKSHLTLPIFCSCLSASSPTTRHRTS